MENSKLIRVVGLKSVRNLQGIVTGVVVLGLIAAGFAGWSGCGAGDSRHLASSACCVAGAVGVIWLGWNWLMLSSGVTSIVNRLKEKRPVHIGTKKRFTLGRLFDFAPLRMTQIDELSEVINNCFGGNISYISELEEQIKDLQIKVQLLRRQKRNADEIIYSIRDAVVVIDEFDKLLMANESAEKLFNFDFKNSKHKPVSEAIGADKSGFVDFLRQSIRSKVHATRREIKITDREEKLNAKERIFDCVVSCAYDEGKHICGVVAVLHDITREKEISQMKNDFVGAVCHELKTPLASITAYSEMLLDGEADDEQMRKEFYSVIQGQAKRLNRLIEDILNTSRIESGLIKVEKKPVSLTILIKEQLQMIRSYAEEKNIEIIEQKPIVFDQVYADKDMISQVIVNLLSNAVKYTLSGGSIKIENEVCLNRQSEEIVRVSVTDTGVGIPEDEIEHVFDKFYRVGANESCAKGTGLGLDLVKQIVERVHGGRVFVTSEVGVGSTFGFELPLATAEVVEA